MPRSRPSRDHPRLCGEHARLVRIQLRRMGSSPLVRGALVAVEDVVEVPGIIPACAGSTSGTGLSHGRSRDHPRLCGEHHQPELRHEGRAGSSPLVRGAPFATLFMGTTRGIIPACAGSTWEEWTALAERWDHPRLCGEHGVALTTGRDGMGSSPLVRGARAPREVPGGNTGIIPACAGSTRTGAAQRSPSRDHPRLCGEHESGHHERNYKAGSSPLVRGAPVPRDGEGQELGIIPACVGSTPASRTPTR